MAELVIEEMEESKAPPRRGAGGKWKVDVMRGYVEKWVKKAKNGGKTVFGVPTLEAIKQWHEGNIKERYAAYYLKKQLTSILDDLGVEGYDIYSTNAGGKSRVIVKLTHATF